MIAKLAKRTLCTAGLIGLIATGLVGCASSKPTAQAAKPKMACTFWPPDPDEPRIQFLGTISSSDDVAPTESSDFERLIFGKDSVRVAHVNKPYGVASRDGKIYVCDIRAKALVVMDLVKKQTRLVGITGATRLQRPVAVAVADDGEIFVADNVHGAILVFDRSERFSRFFEIPKLKPASLAIFGDRLYVADMARQQVLVLDRTSGKETGVVGSVGDEGGQFRLPVGVATDKDGNLFVSDMMRCCVQKFGPDGAYIGGFGELGDHAGGFARPKHLAVDAEGVIYVVDSGFQNVQMFDDKFQLLMHFGSHGSFPGAMDLPVGVCVTRSGLEHFQAMIHPGFEAKELIIVANQFGNAKVSLYARGERRPSYTQAQLREGATAVPLGVGTPSAESLRFQNVGGIEPPPEDNFGAEPEPAGPPTGSPPPSIPK